VAYESTFGNLDSSDDRPARPGADSPLRIAVLADLRGRQQREPAGSSDELLARKPVKIGFNTFDEVLESVAPQVEFAAGGDQDVTVELEPTELDDFEADAIYRRVDRLSDLEGDEAAALLREILHNPLYQALESTWRGIEWLLRRVQKSDRIQIVLLDVTAEELAADLMAGDDLKQSALYRLLIEKTAEGPDGKPWGILVGNYTFDETAEHAELLGRMARIAARAGAPFLSAVSPRVVAEGYEVPAEGKEAWLALRQLSEAAYLGLAAPRFLLRPPFGENFHPPESLKFEEFAGSPDGYLWGNPAFACAALLARGFMQSGGWGFQPAQFLSLDSMPMHSYRDADGETLAVCGEGRFATSTSEAIAKRGFMPLLTVRGRDSIELAAIRSLAAEKGALAGAWQGAAPSKKSAKAGGPANVGVGMMSGKGSGTAAPKRGKKPAVSADEDSESAAGDDDAPSDEPTADEDAPADSDSGSDEPVSEELDPELAALLGGSDSPSDDTAAGDDEPVSEELDPELAALLGGSDSPSDDSSAGSDEPISEELDPELAALMGDSGSASEESPAEDVAVSEELDPELAALLGGSDSAESADETPADAETEADSDSSSSEDAASEPEPEMSEVLDPELAALLGGGDSDESADETPTEAEPEADSDSSSSDNAASEPDAEVSEELDPELAALLGDSGGDSSDAAPEAEVAPESDSSDQPADEPPPPAAPRPSPKPSSDPIMATATDDRPDLDGGDESAASPAAAPPPTPEQVERQMQAAREATHYGTPGSGSPPLVDFKSLVMPISAEQPAGGGVPFDVREQLEQARKEVNPDAFDPDDPLRPDDWVRADWAGIIATSQETLRHTSKNLLVAARLLEALAKKHGFAGLRDGLHLMRLLVEVCWDRLDPPVEDEDLEVRAAPFHWIDDPDRGACFPNSVRAMTLLTAGETSFSWLQWQQSQAGGVGTELIDRAILAAPREQCQALVDNLSQAVLELKHLIQYLNGKLASDAPGFTALRPAMEDCLRLAEQILQRKGPAASQGEESSVSADGSPGGGTGRPRLSGRDDIYQALADAAAALERLEPHSPVPFLVRRAVEMGGLPFPLLMQALIRDANVLSEMNRELGIKGPEVPPPA